METASLAAVEPPDITYRLLAQEELVGGGRLSALQLEAVVYACQRHQQVRWAHCTCYAVPAVLRLLRCLRSLCCCCLRLLYCQNIYDQLETSYKKLIQNDKFF